MDKTTYEVRMAQWSSIMQECNASGLTKRQWCRENDIDEKQFYYWQRRIRKMVLQSVADVNSKPAIAFAELPIQLQNCQPAYEAEKPNKDFLPEMVLQKGNMTIKISNRADQHLLSFAKELFLHAE